MYRVFSQLWIIRKPPRPVSEVLAVYEAAATYRQIWNLEAGRLRLTRLILLLLPLQSFVFRLTGLFEIVVEASRFVCQLRHD